MGNWSFHLSGPRMVPDSMARLMVRNQHSRKGALAHCRSTGYMGAPLCSDKSHPILRQLRSRPMPRN